MVDSSKVISSSHHVKDDVEELRRQQAHAKFTASHHARHATRQRSSGGGGDGGVGDDDGPQEENAATFNEAFAAETKDITSALARLVEASTLQRSHAAAGTGLSGARYAHVLGEVPRESTAMAMTTMISGGDGSSAAVDDDGGGDRSEGVGEQLDTLVDRVKRLRKQTAEACLFLTVYDLRRAQEEVGKLWASVESTRAELVPRKKFCFRRKYKANGKEGGRRAVVTTREGGQEAEGAVELGGRGKEEGHGDDGPGLSGLTGEEVAVLAEDADKDKDFNVTDLDRCKVTILHVLGALRLRRLTSCRVVCGAVRGPIYVEGCRDCVVVAAGRQLRIHDSQGVDFYVLVASGPIIEDCSGLRFAPTALRYQNYSEHLHAAGLDKVVNVWADVKDFNWHRAHKSPNWNVIPEAERGSESDSLALEAQK